MPRPGTPPENIGYTRCEHCSAVLPVSLRALAQAGGMVRCGSCGRTLNALAAVFPDYPEEQAEPLRPGGMPPMLQPEVRQERIVGTEAPPDSPDGDDDSGPELHLDLTPDPPPAWAHWLWPGLALVAVLVLGVQLFGPAGWRVDPAAFGFGEQRPVALEDALVLVSRDMHPHPSLSDAIIISAVIQNRSEQRVTWPDIRIRLFDASQQVVGQRRLVPREYLDASADLSSGFAPGARIPVVLEMVIEASRPSGFAMEFLFAEPPSGAG